MAVPDTQHSSPSVENEAASPEIATLDRDDDEAVSDLLDSALKTRLSPSAPSGSLPAWSPSALLRYSCNSSPRFSVCGGDDDVRMAGRIEFYGGELGHATVSHHQCLAPVEIQSR